MGYAAAVANLRENKESFMGIKILVVDDEPDLELLILQKFRKKIETKEIEFIFAQNGVDALDLIHRDSSIEIIVTDVNMPKMDGLDLLAHLNKMKRVIKTVIVSPYGDMDSIRTAMNLGAFDFITRPINLQDLEITILKTIQQLYISKTALSTENRLMDIEKELAVAKSIQTSIIPHDFRPFPKTDNFELLGTMLPARHIGGDFFDFFKINDRKLGFNIGDVSGKGIPAALFMTMTRALLRALGKKTLSPKHCLEQLNDAISQENESSMFVTAFYGIYDIIDSTITYCNAGHNPPYLISADGTLTKIALSEGIALGVSTDNHHFVEKVLELNKDDCFLLYTDGVTEAMNEEHMMFTEQRLEHCLKLVYKESLPKLIESIVKHVKDFTGGIEASDDITILALRRNK